MSHVFFSDTEVDFSIENSSTPLTLRIHRRLILDQPVRGCTGPAIFVLPASPVISLCPSSLQRFLRR